jgi:hypothetical protein
LSRIRLKVCPAPPLTAACPISELSDEQWELVRDVFDPPGCRGPRARVDRRAMVEGMLWLARTGAQWRELPDRDRGLDGGVVAVAA